MNARAVRARVRPRRASERSITDAGWNRGSTPRSARTGSEQRVRPAQQAIDEIVDRLFVDRRARRRRPHATAAAPTLTRCGQAVSRTGRRARAGRSSCPDGVGISCRGSSHCQSRVTSCHELVMWCHGPSVVRREPQAQAMLTAQIPQGGPDRRGARWTSVSGRRESDLRGLESQAAHSDGACARRRGSGIGSDAAPDEGDSSSVSAARDSAGRAAESRLRAPGHRRPARRNLMAASPGRRGHGAH